jgi:hypothetical protein
MPDKGAETRMKPLAFANGHGSYSYMAVMVRRYGMGQRLAKYSRYKTGNRIAL